MKKNEEEKKELELQEGEVEINADEGETKSKDEIIIEDAGVEKTKPKEERDEKRD